LQILVLFGAEKNFKIGEHLLKLRASKRLCISLIYTAKYIPGFCQLLCMRRSVCPAKQTFVWYNACQQSIKDVTSNHRLDDRLKI